MQELRVEVDVAVPVSMVDLDIARDFLKTLVSQQKPFTVMLDKCAPDVGAAWALTQFRSGACKVTPVTAPITFSKQCISVHPAYEAAQRKVTKPNYAHQDLASAGMWCACIWFQWIVSAL